MVELDRYTVEGVGRVYTDGVNYYPSTTTVLDTKPTPIGLKIWKKNNPDWRDILFYKQNRGTLIHWELLNDAAPAPLPWNDDDEGDSERKLRGDDALWERYCDDLEYAREAWAEIREERGIHPETVLDVECFIVCPNPGFAGQFDLLYQAPDGDIVLADIKTSKQVYDKHQIQSAAYAMALEVPVDRIEILRIHPDSRSWQVSDEHRWGKDRLELWQEFRDLRNNFAADKMRELELIAESGDD